MSAVQNIKTLYGLLQYKNISEMKPWDVVHVDLIGSYIKYMRQHQTGRTTIDNYVCLTCMTMIDPDRVSSKFWKSQHLDRMRSLAVMINVLISHLLG